MAVEKEKLISMFKTMVRIRRFEEAVYTGFEAGEIPGFVHTYIGEEPVAAAVCANLKDNDYIATTHRGHGHVLAKGGKMNRMLAEIYGKKTGYCKGKGGSMHLADVSLGILGANGLVGAGIPIATGAALAAKMKGTDQVAVVFFGDGASNTTRFHEAINLASIWKLPVIYLCENNLYAEYTPITESTNITNISDRAVAYGIPGVTVEGNDILSVYEAVNKAVTRARKGEGPTLLECRTYRFRAHDEGEPQNYRTKEEIAEHVKQDAIPAFRKKLIKDGVLTEKEADEIDQAAIKERDAAVKFAKESPEPDPIETLEDVYV
ncbi:thiamine pyrophosphate-dependent dehydrogenase E1 component subunit alpha [Chloroflexota bacterium]